MERRRIVVERQEGVLLECLREMRGLLLLCVLGLLVSCSKQTPLGYEFWSPSGKRSVTVDWGAGGMEVGVSVQDHSPGSVPGRRVRVFEESVGNGSQWVGWSENEKQVSVLLCNPEGRSQILRLSTEDAGRPEALQEARMFEQADRDLHVSLQQLQSSAGQRRDPAKEENLVDWYCGGEGHNLNRGRYDASRRMFVIPARGTSK